MRRNIRWAAVTIVAALIQTTWLDAIRFQGVLPDLILLLVVYFAIADGEERAMFTAVLGGIYQDVAGNYSLGHNILCLAIVGYIVGRVSTRLIIENPAVKAGLVLLASIAHGVLFTFILYVQKPHISAVYTISASVVPGAFYTALLTPLVFLVLAWSFHRDDLLKRGAL